MIDMTEMITQVGFPIAVTAYLLYERTQINKHLVASLAEITATLDNINIHVLAKLK